MQLQIPVDSELNALIEYDHEFPFFFSLDNLDEYYKGFVNWHKQPTIEISIVYEGAVHVNILENVYTVEAGSGFLIMPGFLHSIRPTRNHLAAKYFTVIFHPKILYGSQGSFYDLTYYRPWLSSNIPCFIFGDEEWVHTLGSKLFWVKDHYCKAPQIRLETQRLLQDVWILLFEHLSTEQRQTTSKHDTKKIFDLVDYLHEHYSEKFSLSDMARNVSMSRNECCRYFKKMMNMTITEYLTEYRLSQAISLLETSALSITEISERTGFCDVSYFIKTFRLKTGITPKAYAASVKR
ncbi:MAG: AraC family transcriptional regulator [Lachnospiraceae bacterium]|nr:AraC family transcriptional regulator [Lachnospiraceae bacterium]